MKQRNLRILKKTALLAVALSALLLFTVTLAFGQEQDDDGEDSIQSTIKVEQGADLQALAKITPEEAKAAALDSVSGATAEEAELENENGYLVYAVDLMKNGEAMEVLIDAGNGSVLRMEADDEDDEDGEEMGNEEDEGNDEQYEDDEENENEHGEMGEEEEEGEENEQYEEENEAEEENGEREEAGENEASAQAELPQAVRDAFQSTYPGAQITGTDMEEEGGETFYEVESRDGDTMRDLLYRPDGTAYETEEQVAAAALPDAVRQAAEAQGEIVKAEHITREGDVTEYEIAVRQGGEEHEVVLDANGQVLEDAGSDEQ